LIHDKIDDFNPAGKLNASQILVVQIRYLADGIAAKKSFVLGDNLAQSIVSRLIDHFLPPHGGETNVISSLLIARVADKSSQLCPRVKYKPWHHDEHQT